MKFNFCSDGDCPLWALAALHALGSLPAPLFRRLVECVVDGQNDDNIMDILKDTSLSSRDESARAAAAVRWVVRQARRSGCPGALLTRDLLVLGLARSHAAALADAADGGRGEYERGARDQFIVNRLIEAAAAPGPAGSDTVRLTLYCDDSGDASKKELLIDRAQAAVMLAELKIAYEKMEGLGSE